jgi:hypothetical protein
MWGGGHCCTAYCPPQTPETAETVCAMPPTFFGILNNNRLKTKKNIGFLGKPMFFARLVQQPAGLSDKSIAIIASIEKMIYPVFNLEVQHLAL